MNFPQKTSPFKNRSRATILTDILEYCRKPALQTHVMYKANLSYSTLKTYIEMLVDSGLLGVDIDPETSGKVFRITQKGMKFLEQTKLLSDMLGEAEFID